MLINLSGDEERRLKAIQALRESDESRDEVLQKFVLLTSQALGIPGSFISVIDDENQLIKVSHNFNLSQSRRIDSFCRYVVDVDKPLVVTDTQLDMRFAEHPLTLNDPWIRFYAGVPLKTNDGVTLGTLCVTDSQPHAFSSSQLSTLRLLADLIISFLQAWHAASFIDVISGLPNRQRLLRDMQNLPEDEGVDYRLILIDCIDLARAYELARSMGMGPVESLLKDMATLLPLRLKLTRSQTLYAVATGRFAVLTRADDPLTAHLTASRLQGISAYVEDDIAVELSTYAGETLFRPHTSPANEIVRQAVSALHDAIELNLPALTFDNQADNQHRDDFLLMNDLAEALRLNKGLYLVYQPKVSLPSGKPVGLEALMRWRHPTRGELAPAMFIPLAEKSGILSTLTTWVINETIQQLKHWSPRAWDLPVSVNVSERDFSRPEFADRLEQKMRAAKLPSSLLGIECLETERITESPAALQGLERLKQKGFSISLDDFGTGYSNISYLRRIPLDVIKLDRSLINDLTSDTATRIIARSIILMLKELDYVVLAEGVESQDTVEMLQQYGCDQIQGFIYSKPLPAAELESWLRWKLA